MAALTVRAAGSPLQPPGGSPFNLPMASLEGRSGAPFLVAFTTCPCTHPCTRQACYVVGTVISLPVCICTGNKISWASRLS